MRMLESAGKNEARAYVVLTVPPPRPQPPLEADRVRIVDPRRATTAPSGAARVGSGPRNPEQSVWPPPPPPGVDLPDRLPANKAQRVILDPELVARWRAEAAAQKETP